MAPRTRQLQLFCQRLSAHAAHGVLGASGQPEVSKESTIRETVYVVQAHMICSIYPYIYICIYIYIWYLSNFVIYRNDVKMCICFYMYYPSIYPSIHLSIHTSIYLFIHIYLIWTSECTSEIYIYIYTYTRSSNMGISPITIENILDIDRRFSHDVVILRNRPHDHWFGHSCYNVVSHHKGSNGFGDFRLVKQKKIGISKQSKLSFSTNHNLGHILFIRKLGCIKATWLVDQFEI